jgi:DNA gyrase subunit A
MFFTSKGKVYRLKCYEIPEGSRTSKGINIVNLLPIDSDEKVTSMIRVPSFEDGKYFVMVTRKGIIKRTELNAYNTARKGGLIAVELDEGDELAWVRLTDGKTELIIGTKEGKAIRFNENDVRVVDIVIGMSVLRQEGRVLTVSETGYGRLSPIDNYRVQSRGGKGIKNYHVERYGKVATIKVVDMDDDIIIISQNGVIIRIKADSIRECARPSKGVRVMKIKGDNKVVTLARAPHADEVNQADEINEAFEDDEQNT